MPSPFPGMDPFIENQRWKSFHSCFIADLGATLTAMVRPRYVVDIEENVYLGDNQLDLLASLKSKNEMIADIVMLLQSPINRVIGGLQNKKGGEAEAA